MRIRRVEVTPGFLLVAALLYYLDRDNVLLWSALACALHELGHWAMIRLCGGEVALLRLSASGAELRLSARHRLGHGAHCLCALAGPGVNLALAFLAPAAGAACGEGWDLFSGVNLSLAAFNLLPVRQLDGGRALWHLAAGLWGERCGARAVRWSSAVTLAALTAAGAAQFWLTGYNFTLLLTTLWLIYSLTGLFQRKTGPARRKKEFL